ncbi:hypothetical protein [Rhizobium sp. BK176]|uniref:hypothetical protein n=1 Tax=Rhizobium sp. BK176 TaxID=2587071 RepID=UPI00216A25C6|nr:hypothetical protein [Rhizobium sp. BK176]MCS4090030.1 hypothetical protein [Rhizobium sp. BK176]
MKLTSKISPDIEIEHVDEPGQPEHFVLRRDGYSYSVLPGSGCLTNGDVDTVVECAAPTAKTHGASTRIAGIHDPVAARISGQTGRGGWLSRLLVLASPSPSVDVGGYYAPSTFGEAPAVELANETVPSFVGVFEDVTEEFLAAASSDEVSAREAIGPVWQRACVDTAQAPTFDGWHGDAIAFAGTFAPGLSSFNPRERLGLLIEAGFRDIVDFEERCWRPRGQTAAEALELLSGETHPLPGPSFEASSYYRLHSDDVVLREVYGEIVEDAANAMRKIEAPRNDHKQFLRPMSAKAM